MEKYKNYKDSGVEWLGEIPSHWQHKKVKHLLVPAKKSGIPAGDAKEDGEFPFFTCSPIVNRIDKAVYHEPSIMLSTGGTACVNYCDSDFSTSTDTYVLQKYENMKFMYYFLYGFTQVINDFGFEGMGLKHLQKSFLNNMDVYLPDKVEIDRIVKYLDTKTQAIDSTIQKKQELVEKLKLAKQALITQVVTKGLDPTVPMKDSGVEWIGEIPEHWEICKVKHMAVLNKKNLNDNFSKDNMIKYIDIGSVNSFGEVKDLQEIRYGDAPSRARRIVSAGDIIVSTVRTYLRAITSFNSVEDNTICSTGFAVLTPNNDVNNKYLGYYIRANSFIETIVSISRGVSYPAVNGTDIMQLYSLRPTLVEQAQIAEYLDKKVSEFDKLIKLEEQSIEKLKLTKQKLITEVVTGKINV